MSPLLQFNDAVMPKLTGNSRNKYSHIHLLLWSATTSDGFMSSSDQFQHYIMPELTGDSCYKNLHSISDGLWLLLPLLHDFP